MWVCACHAWLRKAGAQWLRATRLAGASWPLRLPPHWSCCVLRALLGNRAAAGVQLSHQELLFVAGRGGQWAAGTWGTGGGLRGACQQQEAWRGPPLG